MQKINCKKCNKLIAEISKGKVRNNAAFYCEECDRKRDIPIMSHKLAKDNNPFAGMFGGNGFGGI